MELKELIDKVVCSYYQITKPDICSYGLLSDNGDYHKFIGPYVCHASIKYESENLYDHLVTSYPTMVKSETELDVRFFNFMRNYLYKNWAEYIHLEKTESDKYYIRISNLSNIPAQVVFNFCICSRIPVEFRGPLKKWAELVDLGVHPSIAFAVCLCAFDPREKGKSLLDRRVTDVGCPTWHWPFDITVNVRQLIHGPKPTSGMWKSKPSSSFPCNIMWGDTKDLRKLKDKTIREWQEEFAA